MTITVKFFASLRERLGRSEMTLDSLADDTVERVWVRATDQAGPPENILLALNRQYVDPGAVVKDGDEVAFFPPVTGGGS